MKYGRVLCTSPCPSCPHKGLPRAGSWVARRGTGHSQDRHALRLMYCMPAHGPGARSGLMLVISDNVRRYSPLLRWLIYARCHWLHWLICRNRSCAPTPSTVQVELLIVAGLAVAAEINALLQSDKL